MLVDSFSASTEHGYVSCTFSCAFPWWRWSLLCFIEGSHCFCWLSVFLLDFQIAKNILGGITEIDYACCNSCCRSVVCLSVCMFSVTHLHPVKATGQSEMPFDRTLMCVQVTSYYPRARVLSWEGMIWGQNPLFAVMLPIAKLLWPLLADITETRVFTM